MLPSIQFTMKFEISIHCFTINCEKCISKVCCACSVHIQFLPVLFFLSRLHILLQFMKQNFQSSFHNRLALFCFHGQLSEHFCFFSMVSGKSL